MIKQEDRRMNEQEALAAHIAAKKAQLANDTPETRAAVEKAALELAQLQDEADPRRGPPTEEDRVRNATNALESAKAAQKASEREHRAAIESAEEVLKEAKAAEAAKPKQQPSRRADEPQQPGRRVGPPDEPQFGSRRSLGQTEGQTEDSQKGNQGQDRGVTIKG